MKITQNTPQYLIIDHVELGTALLCLVWALIWVGGAVAWITQGMLAPAMIFLLVGTVIPIWLIRLQMQRSQLVFDRTEGSLEIRQRSFRGYTRHPFPLDKIKRVYIGKSGPDSGRLFFEVRDAMDAGHHQFPKLPIKLDDIASARNAITKWLAE